MTQDPTPNVFSVNRRDFLKASAAVGAGLVLAPTILGAEAKGGGEKELNVALIGAGIEGQVLLYDMQKYVPGLKFAAVCDIWPYNQRRVVNTLKKYKQAVTGYEDYREMLATEKALDAVVIATPDFMHAEQTIACLKAGKHVYCEKEMSNKLEDARAMVVAARESKLKLQIGHQRRSNPRYLLAKDYITKMKVCGRVVQVAGQWNRYRRMDHGEGPKDTDLDAATLAKYGYASMRQLRDWRWFKKFSGGTIADLGSHQIDVFSWFLGAQPRAVVANGGLDYYTDQEWYDTMNVFYEWDVPGGDRKQVVRGFYQLLTDSSNGGYFESFIGDEGALTISEMEGIGGIRREEQAPRAEFEKLLKPREKEKTDAEKAAEKAIADAKAAAAKAGKTDNDPSDLDVQPPSNPPGRYFMPIEVPGTAGPGLKPATKPEHTCHLENFFDAIRKGVPLNCPPEVGYETCVTVLKVNDSLEQGKRLEFKPEEFKA
jgi:predicted dehydrogenase